MILAVEPTTEVSAIASLETSVAFLRYSESARGFWRGGWRDDDDGHSRRLQPHRDDT